jgi:hypothetical protein
MSCWIQGDGIADEGGGLEKRICAEGTSGWWCTRHQDTSQGLAVARYATARPTMPCHAASCM